MTSAIVFTFAVEKGLAPVVGAAPYGVLARQVPRLVVNCLNEQRSAGMRFFPFLGREDGERRFFTIDRMLGPEKLSGLHGLPDQVSYLVDGKLDAAELTFRVFDGELNQLALQTFAFDPLDPIPATRRLAFELCGVFGWSGPPPVLPEFDPRATAYFLVAKDDLLCLEAEIPRGADEPWTRSLRVAFDARPEATEVQVLLLDVCRHLRREKVGVAETRDLLVHAAGTVHQPAFHGEVAAILEDLGCRDEADALFAKLDGGTELSEAVTLRLAAYLFRHDRFTEGRDHLERLRARGAGGNRVLAQLAVLYERLDQPEKRLEVVEELGRRDNLPPAVTRMCCSEFVGRGRIAEALALVERCLRRSPDDPAVWLEQARVQLHADDVDGARQSLQSVLRLQPAPPIREEALRLQRFTLFPLVLPALRAMDDALVGQHLERAAKLAQDLVREQPELAEGWLFLGVAHQRAERTGDAIAALRRAVQLDGTLGEAQNRLGILLVASGQHREGLECLQRAVACLPDESGPRLHMAQACALIGDLETGRRSLEVAERLGADPGLVESVRRSFFAEE